MSRLATTNSHDQQYPKPAWLVQIPGTRNAAQRRTLTAESFPLYAYHSTMDYTVDGDTVNVMLHMGDRTHRERRIRLLGFNAPEVVGKEKAAGLASEAALALLIPATTTLYLATYEDRESFDRLLAWAYADGEGNALLDIAAAMIAGGYGEPA